MIKANKLSFGYASQLLFDEVNFAIGKNQKIGLVGPNGAGKSTLFKLITQQELPTGGTITTAGKIILVPQEVKHDRNLDQSPTVGDFIDPEGKKLEHELTHLLNKLEMDHINLKSQPKQLSGGEKTKLALIRALIAEPDILLLDEPTNFLDRAGKRWVMQFLSNYPKTLIIVSHDLQLLDKQVDKILYLNIKTKKIDEYRGNYSKFVDQKAEKEALLKRKIVSEKKHIKRMESGLKKLYRYRSVAGIHQRVMLERRIEKAKANLPEMPSELRKIKVRLPEPAHIGSVLFSVKNISKSFESLTVLEDISFYLEHGERIALVGPNGSGKSTLIKIIMGLITPDRGEVRQDTNLKIGYYSQEFETFDLDRTLIQTIADSCRLPDSQIRPLLARFLFPGDKIFQKVETLSGGEKTRLSIALLMLQNYNLLILDEPTTYLDVLSQRVILEALKEYQGGMLFVSHTEEFVSELKPSRAIILPEEEIKFWTPELTQQISVI